MYVIKSTTKHAVFVQ